MEPLEADDPRQVGRFEIVARLGAGGMGRVYLARLPSGEQFALKMIHQFLSDDLQFRRRFHREVMAAQRVVGENTAALVDADPDARPPWMAVEYVDGPTLTELIDGGGPLTLGSCVRLASGMAQALISIHAVGLVHRDLKPSNVLMGERGARLIDFGIAQASGASSLTMTGLVTGSAGFMSPEQAQAEHVTEASDVFALGTVLYYAATGRRPFGEGSMISVTYRVVHADPDLSGIRDAGLRELIADCLMKDPARRPTPAEVYQRCPGILDGSWSAGRSGETVSTLTPVPPADSATLLHPALDFPPAAAHPGYSPTGTQPGYSPTGTQSGYSPAATQPGYSPMPAPGQATRRKQRGGDWSDRLRDYARRPQLAIPAGVAMVLTAGTVLAVLLGAGDPGARLGPNTPTVTEEPVVAEPTSEVRESRRRVRPSIITVPTRTTSPKPSASATTKPTTKPSPTKSELPIATTTTVDPVPTTTDDPGPVPETTTPPPPVETTTPEPTASIEDDG